jgi:class 3 adenylate cyclase/tetratricopeptide (TPR) repeat protein
MPYLLIERKEAPDDITSEAPLPHQDRATLAAPMPAGRRLWHMRTCPSCGNDNPDDARFCNACATPLQTEATERREERKVVTVLFCDLVGSTAQAERMDPEDVRALLSRYHSRVRSELERFGGTVEKFIGDAVMALFGAPTAREDDPERAVRAALAVRVWAREEAEVQVRIGITTGETVVALGARPELGEGMAAGDVVNTAARLQSAAPVNGILVDERTFRATERAIEYATAESVGAKGKSEPVLVWQAVEARSRYGVDVRQMGATPLVGRERERRMLSDALDRVQDEHSTQLVTLVGVPGIGKSRLVWELFRYLERGVDLVTWRQGRSLPYGAGVAFWALGEIVKAQAGILETDDVVVAEAKLARAVRTLVADERDAAWVERQLRPLLGLADAGGERGEAFAAWRRFLESLAELRPLVLVFEDLHFADDGLLDFVDHLADWVSGVPLLIVATARPELLTRRPAWGGGKPNAVTISLSPLSDDETAHLVHGLLDRSVLDARLQRTLLDRAGGNPLYAEEFARLVEAGREPAELPETVQGIVAARLDLLPGDEKRLLQDASVVGKVFWLGALARLDGADRSALEERLHTLERQEFLRRERTPSLAGETEYAFRHILVRDVAYGQIPRAERAEKHRLAAEWIESLGRPHDNVELIAHHYVSALELAGATGADTAPLADSARTALRDAGDRAVALNAYPAAVGFYDRALELWPADDDERLLLAFKRARALAISRDERAAETLDDVRETLVAAGDAARAAEACTLLAELWWDRGQRERTSRYLDEARELVADAAPSPAKASVLAEVSRYSMLAGDDETTFSVGSEALEMAGALELHGVRAHVLNSIGSARSNAGDIGGIADLERSVELARTLNLPELGRAYNNLGASLEGLGRVREGLEFREKAVRAAEKFGVRTIARFAALAQPMWDYPLGNWEPFVTFARSFLDESARLGGRYQDGYILADLAMIALAREDPDALPCAEHALELAREAGDPQIVRPVLAHTALVELELGRLDAARTYAAEAAVALTGSVATERPDAVLSLAAQELGIKPQLGSIVETAPAEDRWAAAVGETLAGDYPAAAGIYAEIGVRPLEARTRLAAGERLIAEGRGSEADEQLEQALTFWRSVGATRYIRSAESLLARAPGAQAEAPL